MSMPTSVRYPPARPPGAPLTIKAGFTVAAVLIIFTVAHLIGALLMQPSSPANPDARLEAAGYQD
jgi:hypothetical protein